jgi:hypothetical protein
MSQTRVRRHVVNLQLDLTYHRVERSGAQAPRRRDAALHRTSALPGTPWWRRGAMRPGQVSSSTSILQFTFECPSRWSQHGRHPTRGVYPEWRRARGQCQRGLRTPRNALPGRAAVPDTPWHRPPGQVCAGTICLANRVQVTITEGTATPARSPRAQRVGAR